MKQLFITYLVLYSIAFFGALIDSVNGLFSPPVESTSTSALMPTAPRAPAITKPSYLNRELKRQLSSAQLSSAQLPPAQLPPEFSKLPGYSSVGYCVGNCIGDLFGFGTFPGDGYPPSPAPDCGPDVHCLCSNQAAADAYLTYCYSTDYNAPGYCFTISYYASTYTYVDTASQLPGGVSILSAYCLSLTTTNSGAGTASITSPKPVTASGVTTPIVPSLILQAVVTGPPTAPTPHSSIPPYSNTGALLQGYCNTPEYVLLDGPTALWAPALGCVGDKTDCCPFPVKSTASVATITVVSTSTVTVSVDPSGANSPYAGVQAYPTPATSNLATLAHCPNDYVSVSGGCCPSGYTLWNAALIGSATPCYSSATSYLDPPPIPVTLSESTSASSLSAAAPSTATQKATSAVVNVIFAIQFPLQPSANLSTGAKAGIGVGASIGGIAIFTLAGFLIWRSRKLKKAKKEVTTIPQTTNTDANFDAKSPGVTTVVSSPYEYSNRMELQTDGSP